MAQTFTLFPRFPVDIQVLIWDLAVRPLPGDRHVQTFLLVDHYYDTQKAPPDLDGEFLRFGGRGELNRGFRLAIPNDNTEARNASSYRADSGLWMACRESRAAMDRYYKRNEWWSEVPGSSQPTRSARAGEYFPETDVAHTASLIARNGGVHHVTIKPNHDMAYFEDIHIDEIEWYLHYAGNDIPIVDYSGPGYDAPAPSFLGANVAFRFDPWMIDALLDRNVHGRGRKVYFSSTTIVDMVDMFHEKAGRTVWFVDARLRRRRENGSLDAGQIEDSKRLTFRSDGYTLREVREEDMPHWEMVADENEQGTVFEFFRALHRNCNGRLEIDGSDRMKVLAREDLV